MLLQEEQEGRLSENRFSSIIAINAQGLKEYPGPPVIVYVNPNEKLGEDVTLVENGKYECRSCNNIMAQYHMLNK